MKKKNDDSKNISFPDYVTLRQKYGCDNCKYNKDNAPYSYYRYSLRSRIKKLFATCNGEPCKRTECKKRCWLVSDLFSLVTAAVIIIAFLFIFHLLNNLLLTLAILFIVIIVMDIICYGIESIVDKIFEGVEKLRRRNYDQKIADMEAINEQKVREEQRQKEEEEAVYKDINEAKNIYTDLSSKYKDKMKQVCRKSKRFPELKEQLYATYKQFLNDSETLLSKITLDNFYYSEIKVLFQFHIPELINNIKLYIKTVEEENETETQIKELIKLLESFTMQINQICNNLSNSESENLVYKMQALREIISRK